MPHVWTSWNREDVDGKSVRKEKKKVTFLVFQKRDCFRCAAATGSTFLKLAGPQLVQMFIGDGAKLVRDAFALAKEKAPAVIFIDELDAIGTRRFDSEVSGDREVQRTMLELLNQLDGFEQNASIKGKTEKVVIFLFMFCGTQ